MGGVETEHGVEISAIDHVNMTVQDLAESVAWYGRVFGFRPVEHGVMDYGAKWVILRSGDSMMCLYEHPDRAAPGMNALATNGIHGVKHFGFRVADRDAWIETMKREAIESPAIQNPRSTSWYVYDPTGHEIEVACWKGDEVSFG